MSRISLCFLVFLFTFASTDLTAQRLLADGNWEAVVLYNRVPFMVQMTPEGKILNFVKELPNNYKAIQKFIESEFGEQQNIYVYRNDSSVESKKMDDLAVELDPHRDVNEKSSFEKDHETMLVTDDKTGDFALLNKTEPVEDDKEIIDPDATKSNDSSEKTTRQSYSYNLVYPGQVAIFNKGQLGSLDEIISIMKANVELQLTMEAFASDRSSVSVTVNQNRLQGIIEYLTVKGIGVERVKNNGMSIDGSKSNTIRILLD